MRKTLLIVFVLGFFTQTSAQTVQWASKVLEFSSEMTHAQYSAQEALGKPNVMPYGGQNPSAWTPDRKGRKEFIKVGFERPMHIQQVAVAESANPGALYRVVAYEPTGKEHEIHTFSPQPIPKLGMMRNIFVEKTEYLVAAIRLEFDGAAIGDYFSIDAIGITDSPYPLVPDMNIPKLMAKGILVERLDENVNSDATELNPILSPDGKTLYFSRRNHPENVGGIADKEDIWFSELDENGNWQPAKNMGAMFNTPGPNFVSTASAATPDGKSVVLILGNRYEPNGKMLSGVSVSDNVSGTWSEPKSIKIDNDYNFNERANYFMSNTRQTLLMSVEREDSHGSRDLYVSFMRTDSTWTEPKNLGDIVNTASEESSPFLANDNVTLYFSSSGFSGFGGADIYMTKRLDDSWQNWSEPENLGADINSKLDDLFFNIPVNSEYAYYSRGITPENADIFRIKTPIFRSPNPMVVVRGKLVDALTGAPLGANMVAIDQATGEIVARATADPNTGEYELKLPAGKIYEIKADAANHVAETHVLDLRNITDEGLIEINNFALKPLEIVTPITVTLKQVYFAFNKASLLPQSFEELDRLAGLMADRKTMEVEIAGHTDNQGDATYNKWLSEWRAKAVAKYLEGKGIAMGRVKVLYFGGEKPVDTNETKAGRANNRRVEFTVIKP